MVRDMLMPGQGCLVSFVQRLARWGLVHAASGGQGSSVTGGVRQRTLRGLSLPHTGTGTGTGLVLGRLSLSLVLLVLLVLLG